MHLKEQISFYWCTKASTYMAVTIEQVVPPNKSSPSRFQKCAQDGAIINVFIQTLMVIRCRWGFTNQQLYNASVSNVVFLLICKLYICIQNAFGHIFYSSRLHLYWQFWQFKVQKLTYMLILAAGGMIPYLSSVPPDPPHTPLDPPQGSGGAKNGQIAFPQVQ